jgi:hypothetical protein
MGLSEEECIETKSYTLVKSCSYGLHEYRCGAVEYPWR